MAGAGGTNLVVFVLMPKEEKRRRKNMWRRLGRQTVSVKWNTGPKSVKNGEEHWGWRRTREALYVSDSSRGQRRGRYFTSPCVARASSQGGGNIGL